MTNRQFQLERAMKLFPNSKIMQSTYTATVHPNRADRRKAAAMPKGLTRKQRIADRNRRRAIRWGKGRIE